MLWVSFLAPWISTSTPYQVFNKPIVSSWGLFFLCGIHRTSFNSHFLSNLHVANKENAKLPKFQYLCCPHIFIIKHVKKLRVQFLKVKNKETLLWGLVRVPLLYGLLPMGWYDHQLSLFAINTQKNTNCKDLKLKKIRHRANFDHLNNYPHGWSPLLKSRDSQ